MRPPDGIEERYWEARDLTWRHVAPLIALGLIVIAGMLGAFGAPDRARTADTEAARLEVFGPLLIRNGEFFEMRFRVDARQPLSKAVLAVHEDIWKDITVNTMIPASFVSYRPTSLARKYSG